MPDQFFYTAIFRPSSGKILTQDGQAFAEHFADEVEMRKRAKQFEGLARSLGEDDPWMVYTGPEPVEAYWARATAEHPEGEDEDTANKRLDAIAAKAGAKTLSVLTAPEVDDSQEARPLPAWAVAQAEVEKAELRVNDLTVIAAQYQGRADALDEQATSTKSDRSPMNPALKVAAEGAKGEADQAKADLYRAEQDLAAKRANLDALMGEAQEEARASESRSKAQEGQRK